MLELGSESERLHREVLESALGRAIDLVVATGEFERAATDLGSIDDARMLTAAGWREAYPLLRERLAGDEIVLLKASRGVALEGILELLEADF
jgi:UDP-N-acetylmuramoyl-tripeptide--D-alanyl-D-alanine ligase